MPSIGEKITTLNASIPNKVCLVAISKTKPIADIMQAYEVGQRIFGENKVQELVQKHEEMPKDIQWHMVGHLQTNKVKYIAPFIDLIHSVDSLKLLKEISKQGKKLNRVIQCLLQIRVASEDTKFGLSMEEANEILRESENCSFVSIKGIMGMATFTDDEQQIKREFKSLKTAFDTFKKSSTTMNILSMGMSGDYKIAIEEGSNMVRIGSTIFGNRNY